MKNKKLSFVMSVFFMSVSMLIICVCIVLPTIKFKDETTGTSTTYVNKNYETNKGDSSVSKPSNDNNNGAQPAETVEFFINEQTVSKTKQIVGETTMFTISFKVFAMNETSSAKTIRASAFTGNYDISKYASFYKLECDELEDIKVIPSGEIEDFDFKLTYVVTDTDNFKASQKYNLAINYMSAEIISANV